MIRWQKKVKVDYREGDTRIVKRLLLWPVCIQDEWRWLGRAAIKQGLVRKYAGKAYTVSGFVLRWENREWVDGPQKLKGRS